MFSVVAVAVAVAWARRNLACGRFDHRPTDLGAGSAHRLTGVGPDPGRRWVIRECGDVLV